MKSIDFFITSEAIYSHLNAARMRAENAKTQMVSFIDTFDA